LFCKTQKGTKFNFKFNLFLPPPGSQFQDVTTGEDATVPDRDHAWRAALRAIGFLMHGAGTPCDALYTTDGAARLQGKASGGNFF
jgi:hypothetical protein